MTNFPNSSTFIVGESGPNYLWSNFEWKGKTIALLYDENLINFIAFLVGTKSDSLLINCWPYFLMGIAHFHSCSHWCKSSPNFVYTNFEWKNMAITFYFDEKLTICIAFSVRTKHGTKFMWTKGEWKGKAIALLFNWNSLTFITLSVDIK